MVYMYLIFFIIMVTKLFNREDYTNEVSELLRDDTYRNFIGKSTINVALEQTKNHEERSLYGTYTFIFGLHITAELSKYNTSNDEITLSGGSLVTCTIGSASKTLNGAGNKSYISLLLIGWLNSDFKEDLSKYMMGCYSNTEPITLQRVDVSFPGRGDYVGRFNFLFKKFGLSDSGYEVNSANASIEFTFFEMKRIQVYSYASCSDERPQLNDNWGDDDQKSFFKYISGEAKSQLEMKVKEDKNKEGERLKLKSKKKNSAKEKKEKNNYSPSSLSSNSRDDGNNILLCCIAGCFVTGGCIFLGICFKHKRTLCYEAQ